MKRERTSVYAFMAAGMALCAAAYAGDGVTPTQIATGWGAMSGGLEAKVVYWDVNSYGLCVLNLKTGASTEIRDGEYSANKIPCWSPDGTRIYVRDNGVATVMNADGTNAKAVLANAGYNQGSWLDDDWIVVVDASDYRIRKVQVNASNDFVQVVDVVTDALAGTSRGYATMCGDYVAWWAPDANVPFGGTHRCIIRNVVTLAEHEALPRDESCCGINLKRDGSGAYIYNYHHHFEDARIQAFDGTLLDQMPAGSGAEIWHPRWSNHEDYVAHMNVSEDPKTNSTHAYVRKAPAWGEVHLGGGVADPDLWVEGGGADTAAPDVTAGTVVIYGAASDAACTPVVEIDGSTVALSGGVFESEEVLSSYPEVFTITATDASSNVRTVELEIDVP
ncbi:MAG: hypothetical protein JW909_04520 [Planctomycetes bacterium]|nr:hypothetical protein [Planctomycetota bacterium]